MARIAGINIPPQQHAEIGLTAIYGIGRSRAREILTNCGIEFSKKVKDLTDADLEKIREQVGKFTVEGDLRREIQLSIKRLMTLAPIVVCVTARVFPAAVSVLVRMLAPVKARVRPV